MSRSGHHPEHDDVLGQILFILLVLLAINIWGYFALR
jgi:hypothetical protein